MGASEAPSGNELVRGVVIVQGQTDLLQVVDALRTAGGLTSRLHGGQEECDQHGDDGDDDKQLDQRECSTYSRLHDDSLVILKGISIKQ